jgi:hypothetical protein
LPFFSPRAHKIEQKKKPEKWDQPQTDHSTISAKPLFNALLPPAPFHKDFDSFCKEIGVMHIEANAMTLSESALMKPR